MNAAIKADATAMAYQMRESLSVSRIANTIALEAHGRDLKSVTPKEKYLCLCAATAALRSQVDSWPHAAQEHSVAEGVTTLRHDGGFQFRHMPDRQLEAYARLLFDRMHSAHRDLMEGIGPMDNARYMQIVTGRR